MTAINPMIPPAPQFAAVLNARFQADPELSIFQALVSDDEAVAIGSPTKPTDAQVERLRAVQAEVANELELDTNQFAAVDVGDGPSRDVDPSNVYGSSLTAAERSQALIDRVNSAFAKDGLPATVRLSTAEERATEGVPDGEAYAALKIEVADDAPKYVLAAARAIINNTAAKMGGVDARGDTPGDRVDALLKSIIGGHRAPAGAARAFTAAALVQQAINEAGYGDRVKVIPTPDYTGLDMTTVGEALTPDELAKTREITARVLGDNIEEAPEVAAMADLVARVNVAFTAAGFNTGTEVRAVVMPLESGHYGLGVQYAPTTDHPDGWKPTPEQDATIREITARLTPDNYVQVDNETGKVTNKDGTPYRPATPSDAASNS